MDKHPELKRRVWANLPYIYFIGLAAFWLLGDLSARLPVNYVALGVLGVLAAQAFVQNKVIGASLGLLGIVVNLFFFLAVLAEFSEFETVTVGALQLISVGSVLSLSGLAMGGLLIATNLNKLRA